MTFVTGYLDASFLVTMQTSPGIFNSYRLLLLTGNARGCMRLIAIMITTGIRFRLLRRERGTRDGEFCYNSIIIFFRYGSCYARGRSGRFGQGCCGLGLTVWTPRRNGCLVLERNKYK